MSYTPRPFDFISIAEITNEDILTRIHATAENKSQQRHWGHWHKRDGAVGLIYNTKGFWSWRGKSTPADFNANRITLTTLFGPELKPGTWVLVKYTSDSQEWHRNWLIGFTNDGRPVTLDPQFPDEPDIFSIDQVRPIPDKVAAALAKLKDNDVELTPEIQQTLTVLDTLGLLQE
jgi:hypothetical protein